MNFSKMRKTTLVALAIKYNLPVPRPASLKVGHLRELLNDHLPEYLELWFLQKVREQIIPYMLRHHGITLLAPGRNMRHLPQSLLEFDFSWKSLKIAVEIQGGLDGAGRKSGHVSASGIRRDMRKLCLSQVAGWILFQFAAEQIFDEATWSSYTMPLLISAIRMRTNAT